MSLSIRHSTPDDLPLIQHIFADAHFVFRWAFTQIDSIRIDTHRDNKPMQHLLNKNGFRYCGIIYLEDGDERLAYQRCLNILKP